MMQLFKMGLLLLVAVFYVGFSYGQKQLFSRLPSSETGITFQNHLVESPDQNIITYEYFFNGGGVAIADFNNDGLQDVFFTSNQGSCKLYLNKGNLKFEDITKKAGVSVSDGWKTGASLADVNSDGWIDLYVCQSGDFERKDRKNKLFINNGDLTFTDKAEMLGIADEGYSTQAAFFDFDRDGDLDLYVMNHNNRSLRNFDAAFVKKMIDDDAGDRLYRNDGDQFKNITAEANIISNPLGYGLGLNIADINNDGWPDIYVTNDYVEEDYLYINNQDGTFTESLKGKVGHMSNFSMGVDVADINNDGFNDIFTLDMLPEDNRRQKLLFAPDNYELYDNQLKNGFYHQLMRNMLQLNNGNGTFSETGQVAGISNTDWSWSALLADYNNDGLKDLFVTNGYGRDMINMDFMKFYANERLKYIQGKTDSRMFQMLQGIKSTPLHNYIFENRGEGLFTDQSVSWGFDSLNFSHGAAYADLDNDGDLDLIVNEMNSEAGIYRNNYKENGGNNNYLDIKLKMPGKNSMALGAEVTLFTSGKMYKIENSPVHGFQSSMLIPLHFAFPYDHVDSLRILWPDGNTQLLKAPAKLNTIIEISYQQQKMQLVPAPHQQIFQVKELNIPYRHKEEGLNDFKVQPMLPSMVSYAGPHIAKADVNHDGLEDFYICGANGQSGEIYIQMKDGSFIKSNQPSIAGDTDYCDTDAVFFDANGDGEPDLYVVSGGYGPQSDSSYQDRLYLNKNGVFQKDITALPQALVSGSCVRSADVDGDGDIDLFVGGRVVPGQYPLAPQSALLINDGKGHFTNEITCWSSSLPSLGMITDAKWLDVNNDKKPDLILCGEWMHLYCFQNDGGKFKDVSASYFDTTLKGWWNRILITDLNQDGKPDIVAGNWGVNSQLHAKATEPIELFYNDFDGNGFIDPLLCYYIQGESRPMASRDEVTDQMISLRQRFPTYDAYADATIHDILTPGQFATAHKLTTSYLNTCWFVNKGDHFEKHELPIQANYSPVYAIAAEDFNKDGNVDLLLTGNVEHTRLKIGKIDANYGVLLMGDGKGNFLYANQQQSGLDIRGSVRDLVQVKNANGNILLAAINNAAIIELKY